MLTWLVKRFIALFKLEIRRVPRDLGSLRAAPHRIEDQIDPKTWQRIFKLLGQEVSAECSTSHSNGIPFRSQYGEDMFLCWLFCYRAHGFVVEIGAFDGITLSNSFSLSRLGWSSLLIEPVPPICERCRANRPDAVVVNAAIKGESQTEDSVCVYEVIGNCETTDEDLGTHSFVVGNNEHMERCLKLGVKMVPHSVSALSFGEALKCARIPEETQIDVMSIDCEGLDLDILRQILNSGNFPLVLVVEDGSVECQGFLRSHGYLWQLATPGNLVATRDSELGGRFSRNSFWRAVGAPAAADCNPSQVMVCAAQPKG